MASVTNIEDLPNELLASILRMTGQCTCARVSRRLHDVQMFIFSRLRDDYSQNPKIRRFMPTYGEILRQTVANVRDYYRKFSGVKPDGFSKTGLIEACDLAELITEADDKNLVTLWNHLPPEIFQQLAILTPYPANATNGQIATAIRNGIQTNREAILAVLSQVTELQIINTDLSALPPEIGLFVNLQTLDLALNKLNTLPPEIGNLVNLQLLCLDRNQITSLPPEIGNLVNLTGLTLSKNQITSLPPEIGHLVNLQVLMLAFNKLRTLPEEIGHLVNLQELWLQCNELRTLPREIGNLVNLQELWLTFNELRTLPREIGILANLQELDLRRNNLFTAHLALIANYLTQNPGCHIYIDPHPVIIPGIISLAMVSVVYFFAYAIHFLISPQ